MINILLNKSIHSFTTKLNFSKILFVPKFTYFTKTKNLVPLNNISFGTSFSPNFCGQKFYCTRLYDVNTNVVKDTILFKYENPRFYTILNICAISQLIFWTYLAHFSFTSLKDAPVDETNPDTPWYRRINLGENKYRNALGSFCLLLGYGILSCAWMFTLRSVRFLILRKGGEKICLVTYTPFGHNRILNVPLKFVSAQESRQSARVQLPIKVKNKAFYYVLDMRGEFKNVKLFDYTAGLNRKF